MSNQHLHHQDVRVLVAEDDYLVCEMIRGSLEEVGYTVVGEAANGFEAVEMTQSLQPDVVLMDIKMPDMDGIEATRLIYESCPTPVVVLTAYETSEFVIEASEAGVGAYLVKPPNVREMERAIVIAMARFGDMMELRDYAGLLEQRVQERTAQLQAQYARLEAILRSASDGIVVTDAEGRIVQANPVALTWFTQTLSPEDVARLQETVRDLARQAEERPGTVLELTGLDLELKAAPILQPGITLPPASGFAVELGRDFGELSRAARPSGGSGEVEALRPAQGEPAAVVDIHDVSHLKALNRMKTRFVTNISHELRTPITAIKLYAALMQRSPPEKWGEYVDALAQEADHQARLVQGILEIARIDAGRLEMKPLPTSLNELAETAVASHQELAQERGLTLECHLAEPETLASSVEPLVALVDPERMRQVLDNLVGNAIRFTPEGGRVVVSIGKKEAEGRTWATATVADTGMGIPEQELPHVFERFFRGEKPRAMQLTGTGLGLAIVKEIVELHGGRVTVESQVDVGATFTVWLPLAEGRA